VKQCWLRPKARADRRAELLYYRRKAGSHVAEDFLTAVQNTLAMLAQHPSSGSARLGQLLQVEGLRSTRVTGFPLSIWYIERPNKIEVIRIIGQRQHPQLQALE
jgi:toxin ParE1/3/4